MRNLTSFPASSLHESPTVLSRQSAKKIVNEFKRNFIMSTFLDYKTTESSITMNAKGISV